MAAQRLAANGRRNPLQELNEDGQSKNKASLADVWKGKAHRLAKALYELEVENRSLKNKIFKKERQGDGISSEEEAATLKNQLEQQARLLQSERADFQRKLRIASGAARAGILSRTLHTDVPSRATRPEQLEEAGDKENRVLSKTQKSGHGDATSAASAAALQGDREINIELLQEDNMAKERELLHALDLLQNAHAREGELRRQACSLAGQLEILRDALQQAGTDSALEDEQDERCDAATNLGDEGIHAQLEEALVQLAFTREEAEMHREAAAVLLSAFKASEEMAAGLRNQVTCLQTYINSLPDSICSEKTKNDVLREAQQPKGQARKTAPRLVGMIFVVRLAVHGLGFLSSALSRS